MQINKCIRIIFRTYSSVRSEQLTHNQKVGGSKPSRSTSVYRKIDSIDWYSLGQCINLWELEQWSARWVHSPEVVSSNLAVGDDFYDDEIIAIDKKLGIVVTKDGNEINYYWIKDPNSKPSLYRRGAYNSLVL